MANRMVVVVVEIDAEHEIVKRHRCSQRIHRISHHGIVTTVVIDVNRLASLSTSTCGLPIRCSVLAFQTAVFRFELSNLFPILRPHLPLLAACRSCVSVCCGCRPCTTCCGLPLPRHGTGARGASRCTVSAITATGTACRPRRSSRATPAGSPAIGTPRCGTSATGAAAETPAATKTPPTAKAASAFYDIRCETKQKDDQNCED